MKIRVTPVGQEMQATLGTITRTAPTAEEAVIRILRVTNSLTITDVGQNEWDYVIDPVQVEKNHGLGGGNGAVPPVRGPRPDFPDGCSVRYSEAGLMGLDVTHRETYRGRHAKVLSVREAGEVWMVNLRWLGETRHTPMDVRADKLERV